MPVDFQTLRAVSGLPRRRLPWPTRAGLAAGLMTAIIPLLIAIVGAALVGGLVLLLGRLLQRLLRLLSLEAPAPDGPAADAPDPVRENVRVRMP